jgi:hypothetical protein
MVLLVWQRGSPAAGRVGEVAITAPGRVFPPEAREADGGPKSGVTEITRNLNGPWIVSVEVLRN